MNKRGSRSSKLWFREFMDAKSRHTSFASTNPFVDIAKDSPHDLAIKAAQEKKKSVHDSLPPSLIANEQDCIAPFRRDEIVLGPLLGTGEFSHVYEIQSFCIKPAIAEDIKLSTKESEKRLHMKKCERYRETKNARYALKHIDGKYLKDFLKQNNSDSYVQAACDIALEAEILASLNHPNIIKLRGITHSGTAGFSKGPSGYFLIIDRLFETLDQRMRRWRDPNKCHSPTKKGRKSFLSRRISFAFASSKSKLEESQTDQHLEPADKLELEDEMMDERLSIALQISAAIMYLHSHSIIFRDLKPTNIGFDVRGDVRIFDFGLARIMPENGRHYNDTFKMSGAGTPRYMAPECLRREAYNMKADVYSFAILFWEMLSGQTPYVFARKRQHLIHYVVNERGRPDIHASWPADIKRMLESSFDSDIERRPEMEFVHSGIKKTLTSLRGGNNAGLSHAFINRRRSCDSFRQNSVISGDLDPLRVSL